jgi:hypothetical protein
LIFTSKEQRRVYQNSVRQDPVCDAENLRRIGDVFERYGSFGEEDALVGVGGC